MTEYRDPRDVPPLIQGLIVAALAYIAIMAAVGIAVAAFFFWDLLG